MHAVHRWIDGLVFVCVIACAKIRENTALLHSGVTGRCFHEFCSNFAACSFRWLVDVSPAGLFQKNVGGVLTAQPVMRPFAVYTVTRYCYV